MYQCSALASSSPFSLLIFLPSLSEFVMRSSLWVGGITIAWFTSLSRRRHRRIHPMPTRVNSRFALLSSVIYLTKPSPSAHRYHELSAKRKATSPVTLQRYPTTALLDPLAAKNAT